MRTLLAVAVTTAMLLPGAAFARGKSVEMNDPVTINLETKASPAQVKKGVKLAVLGRKWAISDDKGEGFDAVATPAWGRDKWSAKVHVAISGKTVKISYVSSEGLDAEGKNIHPTYNKIVGYLEKDIPIYVEREAVSSQ